MFKKIKIINLKVIPSKAGSITKYLNKNDKYYDRFGEIYFNNIKKGFEKGWNLHKKSHCYLYVPFGSVTFTIMDKLKKNKKKITIKQLNPKLLIIPPNFWFKFKSNTIYSIIVNFTNYPHSKKEVSKLSIK